jgi:hypothetical protein
MTRSGRALLRQIRRAYDKLLTEGFADALGYSC